VAGPEYVVAEVDVKAPTRRGYRLEGIALHRATTLDASDRDICRGVPVTSLPRTIIDLATCISRRARWNMRSTAPRRSGS
jgi:hypothetical protein